MRYLKLTLSYDGSNYNGFQRQKNGVGVQQVVEAALSKLLGEEIQVAASGRTDTGVHAREQVISFGTVSTVPTINIAKATRHLLPRDIVVYEAVEVASDFNARYSCTEKTYQYKIMLTDVPDPFMRNYVWELNNDLDIEKMQQAANFLLGTHDFSTFRNQGSKPMLPIRTITKAAWAANGKQLEFTITGDGFLYRMVRNIVGALVKVGSGKITPEEFQIIMLSKDRSSFGGSAPARGLYLMQVRY